MDQLDATADSRHIEEDPVGTGVLARWEVHRVFRRQRRGLAFAATLSATSSSRRLPCPEASRPDWPRWPAAPFGASWHDTSGGLRHECRESPRHPVPTEDSGDPQWLISVASPTERAANPETPGRRQSCVVHLLPAGQRATEGDIVVQSADTGSRELFVPGGNGCACAVVRSAHIHAWQHRLGQAVQTQGRSTVEPGPVPLVESIGVSSRNLGRTVRHFTRRNDGLYTRLPASRRPHRYSSGWIANCSRSRSQLQAYMRDRVCHQTRRPHSRSTRRREDIWIGHLRQRVKGGGPAEQQLTTDEAEVQPCLDAAGRPDRLRFVGRRGSHPNCEQSGGRHRGAGCREPVARRIPETTSPDGKFLHLSHAKECLDAVAVESTSPGPAALANRDAALQRCDFARWALDRVPSRTRTGRFEIYVHQFPAMETRPLDDPISYRRCPAGLG